MRGDCLLRCGRSGSVAWNSRSRWRILWGPWYQRTPVPEFWICGFRCQLFTWCFRRRRYLFWSFASSCRRRFPSCKTLARCHFRRTLLLSAPWPGCKLLLKPILWLQPLALDLLRLRSRRRHLFLGQEKTGLRLGSFNCLPGCRQVLLLLYIGLNHIRNLQ